MVDSDLWDVENRILAEWPGCGADLKIRAWERIGDGWECDTYGLVLVEDDRERALVVRLYPPRSEVDLTPPSSVEDEYRVMSLLHRDGFAVPRVYLRSRGTAGARAFILMDRQEGELLGHLYGRSGAGCREELAATFCRLLVELHSLDPRCYPGQVNPGDSPVHAQLAKFEEYMNLAGLAGLEPGIDWLSRRSCFISPGRRALVHWDYHPQNVLIAPDGGPAVIDWSSAEVTDSRFDVGSTLVFLPNEDSRRQFLAGYEQLSGAPVRDLAFFAAAGCFRRILIILTVLECGPERLGLRSEVRDLVRSKAMSHLADVYRRFRHVTDTDLSIVSRWIH